MVKGVSLIKKGDLTETPQEPTQGKQYFSLHSRMRSLAENKLKKLSRL